MKMDHDIIRTIVLQIEEHQPPNHQFMASDQNDAVAQKFREKLPVDHEVLIEHIHLLTQAGYIEAKLLSAASSKRDYLIIGLTWEGHEFAANARDSGIWRKAQEKAKSISSSVSVSVLSDILKRIMMEAF